MSTFQKPSEIGWMYHAPSRPAGDRPPVEVPPASQIPGLSGELYLDPNTEDPPRRGLIKESDSPYIRMAKQGGREDLLRFRENKPKSGEAVGYPRAEWYYLEDNKMIDEEQKNQDDKPYEFLLPEYMVHHEHKGSYVKTEEEYDPKRAPYAFDKTTVFQREGEKATDKKVKVQEDKRSGYGVRSQKMQGKTVKYNMPKLERAKRPSDPKQKPLVEPPKPVSEADRPVMGKLLSYGYGKDWEDENSKYHNKLSKAQAKLEQTQIGGGGEKMQTEYQEGYKRGTGSAGKPKDRYQKALKQLKKKYNYDGLKSDIQSPHSFNTNRYSYHSLKCKESPKHQQQNKSRKEQEEQELFKLSKFKKVPARIDHTRHSPSNTGGNEMVPVA